MPSWVISSGHFGPRYMKEVKPDVALPKHHNDVSQHRLLWGAEASLMTPNIVDLSILSFSQHRLEVFILLKVSLALWCLCPRV